ncbi:hypothetical protein ACFLXF_02870 [Chloroflexota bacterium]
MTDEDLEKEIQEVHESINKLAESDEPLTKEKIKDRDTLATRKMVLEMIKEAKEKKRINDEIYNNLVYSFLKSAWVQRHPFLASMILRHFRWGTHLGL